MQTGAAARIDWVDYAKGICIIMVVMMHSTLGVEKYAEAEGWMHMAVAFAKPFRMPDFFLISGLFLARVINRPWPDYLDRKVVHFAYFYILWVAIQCVIKCWVQADNWTDIPLNFAYSMIQPFGTMWFIYLLPIFFVACKLFRKVPVLALWTVAALLHIAPIHTGWVVIDEFASRFIFFYSGYVFAPHIFRLAASAKANVPLSLGLFALWAVINGGLVILGYSDMQPISLVLGFAGAFAIVAGAALISLGDYAKWIRYCGANSIVIYLAFFFPMAVTRTALLKFGLIDDVGTISLIVTAVSIVSPLVLFWIVRDTRAGFLFSRPGWATSQPRAIAMQPAE